SRRIEPERTAAEVAGSLRRIKLPVEVRIEPMRLIGQHRAKRSAGGGKTSVAAVDGLAVSNRRVDRRLRVFRNTLLDARRLRPRRRGAAVTERARPGSVLLIDERADGGGHRRIPRRAVRPDDHLTVALESDAGGERNIAAEDAKSSGRQSSRAHDAGE